MSIANNGMVVNLQLGIWQGYRLDKEASRNVTQDANADDDAARVNKHLVPKTALKDIVKAAGAIRTHFYAKTLPWKDNGDRLLTRALYMDFIAEHEKLVTNFHTAVDEFLNVGYAVAYAKAEFRMGDLFKSEDYPSASSLRHRFYVNLDIDAVTEAGDFRVQMDKAHIDSIRDNLEQAMVGRIGRAMQDIWVRLSDTLGHFATKMSGDEIFRDSTIKNLESIVALIPAMNVTNDPDLARIAQEIEEHIIGYTPTELRKDTGVRAAAATEAQRIMEDMRGFMSAFGGAS